MGVADNKWFIDYRDFHSKILKLIYNYVRMHSKKLRAIRIL